jgi:uncharacterized protein YjbI with pentapeptide repeats
MANPEHLKMLQNTGLGMWDAWRRENPAVIPDLSGEDLTGLLGPGPARNLSGANLSSVKLPKATLLTWNLAGANLRGANLRRTMIGDCNLAGADLTGADLTEAMVAMTNLSGATLSEALLIWTVVRGGRLQSTDFSRVRMLGTVFAEVDLSEARGLLAVDHQGPSSIGIETLYRSAGQDP